MLSRTAFRFQRYFIDSSKLAPLQPRNSPASGRLKQSRLLTLRFTKNYYRRISNIAQAIPAYCMIQTVIILSCFFSPLFAHALDVPKLQGYVNDYANMISPPARAELERELKVFEQTDSTQVVILTIPALEGAVIEDFGIKVAESWKIGQKGKDNGIIFIVAKQERKTRVEVGSGLEGRLTDLTAGRIVDLVVKPRFKRGDFDGGFIAGVSSLIDATRGEFKADGNHRPQKHQTSSRFLTFLIFGGIFLLVLGSISRILGGIAGAVTLPAIAHLTGFSPGLVALLILALFGAGAGVLLPLLFSSGGRYRGGGFFPGGGFFGTGGGGGLGGGDFGGGFSGGGGGFSGGGASGDW